MSDLISREALREDFKSRLALCNEWIAKAKDKETKIRASAGKAFIGEVIMTIDNAPTVDTYTIEDIQEVRENSLILGAKLAQRPQGEWVVQRLQSGFDDVYCPYCNARPTRSEYGYYLRDNFCHECGAKMRGTK